MTGRTIVVGDVHGCLRELEELLRRVEHREGDALWFLGDLVNRGPDSAGVVRLARQLGARTVLGNHDQKHLRYRRHLQRAEAGAAREPPMQVSERFLAVHRSLAPEDLDWLGVAPRLARLPGGLVLVHGGLLPGRALDDQPLPLQLRWLDRRSGRPVTLEEHDEEPGESVHWSERWEGPWRVLYGHHAQPEIARRPLTTGIDTGAVYGGHLTAAVLEGPAGAAPRFVQVRAERAYFTRRR